MDGRFRAAAFYGTFLALCAFCISLYGCDEFTDRICGGVNTADTKECFECVQAARRSMKIYGSAELQRQCEQGGPEMRMAMNKLGMRTSLNEVHKEVHKEEQEESPPSGMVEQEEEKHGPGGAHPKRYGHGEHEMKTPHHHDGEHHHHPSPVHPPHAHGHIPGIKQRGADRWEEPPFEHGDHKHHRTGPGRELEESIHSTHHHRHHTHHGGPHPRVQDVHNHHHASTPQELSHSDRHYPHTDSTRTSSHHHGKQAGSLVMESAHEHKQSGKILEEGTDSDKQEIDSDQEPHAERDTPKHKSRWETHAVHQGKDTPPKQHEQMEVLAAHQEKKDLESRHTPQAADSKRPKRRHQLAMLESDAAGHARQHRRSNVDSRMTSSASESSPNTPVELEKSEMAPSSSQ